MKGPERSDHETRLAQASDDPAMQAAGQPIAAPEFPEGAESSSAEQNALATFEHELRKALRPVVLPIEFADRVVAHATAGTAPISAPGRARVLPFRNWRLVAGGAIAAGVLAGAFGVQEVHHRRERDHAAVMANQQFETATRIEEQTLARTREQLRRAGVSSLE